MLFFFFFFLAGEGDCPSSSAVTSGGSVPATLQGLRGTWWLEIYAAPPASPRGYVLAARITRQLSPSLEKEDGSAMSPVHLPEPSAGQTGCRRARQLSAAETPSYKSNP